MSALDDYLHCPALARWLPERLEGLSVCHAIAKGASLSLRRMARRWPPLAPDMESGALVVVGSLRRPAATALVQGLAPGTLVVDIAAVGGLRIGERLFGLAARRGTRRVTAARLSAWLDAGLGDIEQWLTTDPPDTCVTLGYCRAAQVRVSPHDGA